MKNEREVTSDITEDDINAFTETEFDETGAPIEKTPEEEPEKETPEEDIKEEPEKIKEVEEKPDEVEVKPEESVSSTEIKDVEGETPKERALRLEVTRIKREKREVMQQNILLSQEKVVKDDWKKNLRDRGYTEEQIEEQEKLQDDMALAKGFVSKKDLDNEKINNLFSGFLEEHKEYLPENDNDDIRYTRFYQILKSDYDYKNLSGKSPIQIKSIFNKVNRDVVEELGEVKDSKKKIEAQKQKIGAVSVSASGSKSSEPKSEPKNEIPKKVGEKSYIIGGMKFEGFDDEDFN